VSIDNCEQTMSSVLLTIDPRGIATVMLNRPDKHNALNAELIADLHNTLSDLDHNNEVRIVVLTGGGQSFCAGGDLDHMMRMSHATDAENFGDALALARCLRKLDELSKPVIARVNGNAFGGGIGLIACADIAAAVGSARFCFSEVKLGLAAATISPYVCNALGMRTTRRLFLTAAPFNASEARDFGLLHRIVDAQQLDVTIDQEIELLLQGAPTAQAASKQLLRELTHTSEERDLHMARTARLLAKLRTGPEARDGLQAFMEKRKPKWHK
jgi:methylglutaconyl-CoA hydratase